MVYNLECIDGTLAHYWIIEPGKGATSKGTCKKCKQIQSFSNSIGALTSWKEAGKQFQRRNLTNLGRKEKDNESK